MKMLLVAFGLSLASPVDAQPQSNDARLVPVRRDDVYVGLKVYAIKPGGRFALAHVENGDTIERVDGQSVTSDDGARALHDKVIAGTADATITVRRRGELVTLTSRAK